MKKRKKEGGSEKGGWKFTRFTSPGSAPGAPVFYEQIVNEVQPSWLSLVESEGE